MIVVGIGCRRGAAGSAIVSAVRASLERCDVPLDRVAALAAPDFKATEKGLAEAAADLKLPLTLVDEPAMAAAQRRCATVSERTQQAVGIGAVSEAAALAAAGNESRLILAKTAGGDVTCAVASGSVA